MIVLLLCLKVFLSRIADVSLGTMRTIFTVKGKPFIAGAIGFIEVLIWFLVAREAISGGITSFWVPIAYAGGFASGTLIGGLLARVFIKGKISMQVVISAAKKDLLDDLYDNGYALTVIDAYGHNHDNTKYMIYIQCEANLKNEVKKIIYKHDDKAYISINDVRDNYNGYYKVRKK